MNRDIKFRVWDNGNMYDVNTLALDKYGIDKGMSFAHRKMQNTHKHHMKERCVNFYDESVFMQYTGLKDKNGVEIYEGDIVEHYGLIYAVEWDKYGVWMLKGLNHRAMPDGSDQKIGDEMLCNEWKEIEVIGNIYENPLEGK